jgi:anti-sigma B factor antagonist
MCAEEGSSYSLSWSVEQQPGLTLVKLEGELDLASGDAFQSTLEPLLELGTILVLDLDGLAFMDSTGIRILGRAKQQAVDAGTRLLLGQPSAAVRRVLSVAGLTDFFDYVEGPPTH